MGRRRAKATGGNQVTRSSHYRRILTATACTTVIASAVALIAATGPTAPAARLQVVAPPATQDVITPAPSLNRPWPPARDLTIAPRTMALAIAAKTPEQPAEKPPLPATAATLPPPSHPQFAQGPRRLIIPAPALTPRIPNLLVTPRKYAQAGTPATPAAAISTPPVTNVDGTATLPVLPPFTRDIAVEISPPAAPLPFDREPFVQAPDAPDDRDMPAVQPTTAPAKPRLD